MPSLQTRTFLVVLLVAIFAMYAAIMVNDKLQSVISFAPENGILNKAIHHSVNVAAAETPVQINTDSWQQFKDPESNLQFKYPKNWQTTTISYQLNNQEYRISVGPKDTNEPITIYVSKQNYFAMDGLPVEKIKIDGTNGVNVNNMMIGLKKDSRYYTFYAGQTWDNMPEFEALTQTIRFQ